MIMNRAQSDLTGVLLLTAVITLTITGVGAVSLGEYQSDLENGPLADIDSDVTPVNITLEHRGGETLDPDETTIYLQGIDEDMQLENRFQPGATTSAEFERLNDTFDLMVVHEPTQSVVHMEQHQVHNAIEGLLFGVGNWDRPTYVLEGYPVDYSVELDYEFGPPTTITDPDDISVEDQSKLDVDQDEGLVEGLDANSETSVTVEDGDHVEDSDVVILESHPAIDIEMLSDVEKTGATSAEVTSDLDDLAGLPNADVTVEVGPPNRTFVGETWNNEDKMIANGDFYHDPAGYSHGDNYVHDNDPFEPGETRTYYIDESGSGADIRGSLQEEPNLNDGSFVDDIDEVDDTARIYDGLSTNEVVEMEVRYDKSGEKFVFYIDGDRVNEWNDLEDYDELYFVTYEWAGTRGENSLRIIGVDPTPSELREVSSLESVKEGQFDHDVVGVEPGTNHHVRATVEQRIGGLPVSEQSNIIEFETEGPIVETIGSLKTGATSVEGIGELETLGDMDAVDLYFEYGPQNRSFVGETWNNEDKLIANGEFYHDPAGYSHDDNYVHDNEPFEPGDSRTYYIDERGSGADIHGSLQEEPNLNDGSFVDEIDEVDDTAEIYDGLEDGEVARMDVEFDRSGDKFLFYIDGERVNEWEELGDYDELYFVTYEWAGTSGENSLRIIGVDALSENVRTVQYASGYTQEEIFDEEVSSIEPGVEYYIQPYTEQVVDDVYVADRGVEEYFELSAPTIDTLDATPSGATEIEASGDVTLNDAESVDLFFEYGHINRSFIRNSADNTDKLISNGDFHEDPDGYAHDNNYVHDNVPFEPGDNRTYYIDERGSGADLRGSLQEEPNLNDGSFVDDIDEVRSTEEIYENLPNDGVFRLDVEFDRNGDKFNFYIDGELVQEWEDLGDYDELYFVTYEWGGDSGEDSMRIIGVDALPENVGQVTYGTDISDEEFSTEIEGIDPSTDYYVEAFTEQFDGEVRVADRGGEQRTRTEIASIETLDVSPTSGASVEVTGEVESLGDMDTADLYVSNSETNRTFNRDHEDNGDKLIADGEFFTDPNGYAHNQDYIHDNDPIEPGENRTYHLYEAGSGADLYGSLRSEAETEDAGDVDDIDEVSRRSEIYEGLGHREVVELTVQYRNDSTEIVHYVDGEQVVTWDRLGRHDELYFSLYEWGGDWDETSLRLIGADPLPEEIDHETVELNVSSDGDFETEITGVHPDTSYQSSMFTNQTENEIEVFDSGGLIDYEISSQTVETVGIENTRNRQIEATLELTDIGDLIDTDLLFQYNPVNRTFNGEPADNDDKTIADGTFVENDELAGYGHSGDYVHDNEPIAVDESRTYYIYTSEGGSLRGLIRESPKPEPTGERGDSISSRSPIYDPDDHEILRLDVEHTGDRFEVYVDGELERSWGTAEGHDEVYFSTYEWGSSSGESSMRTISAGYIDSEIELEEIEEATDVEDEYTGTIGQLDRDREYEIKAVGKTETHGVEIVDKGERIRATTGN